MLDSLKIVCYTLFRVKKGDKKMFGIYTFENGLKFTGIIAETEEKAWNYLKEKYNTVNKEAFKIKKVEVVK